VVGAHHTLGFVDSSVVAKKNKQTFPKYDLVHLAILTLSISFTFLLQEKNIISIML